MLMILAIGLLFCTSSTCFVISSTLTVLSHTQVLSTISGILLITFRLLTCQDLHTFEKLGIFPTIIGILIMMSDTGATKGDGKTVSLWGEFFGFMCAFFYVFFFLINTNLVKRVHGLIVYNFMMLITIIVLSTILI